MTEIPEGQKKKKAKVEHADALPTDVLEAAIAQEEEEEEEAEREAELVSDEKRRMKKLAKRKKKQLKVTNNHFELKIVEKKQTMGKKSSAAEDFLKSRMAGGDRKRVAAANMIGNKRQAGAAKQFIKKR